MLQVRSGSSVDAIPQQRFARHACRRRYFNATDSLGYFRRRGSEATVRSGSSVDAIPQQRFAQTHKPSTLLQCHGFARVLPSTRFRSNSSLGKFHRRDSAAQVRSDTKAVDATSMPRIHSGTSVDAVLKPRFARDRRPSDTTTPLQIHLKSSPPLPLPIKGILRGMKKTSAVSSSQREQLKNEA